MFSIIQMTLSQQHTKERLSKHSEMFVLCCDNNHPDDRIITWGNRLLSFNLFHTWKYL